MSRFVELLPFETQVLGSPARSSADYYLARNNEIRCVVDIKTRKQSVQQICNYGGLMCRERKIQEFKQLHHLLNIEAFLIWAFDDGNGPMFLAEPKNIHGLVGERPPRRHNYRGEIFDDIENVVYLDWNLHLTRIA